MPSRALIIYSKIITKLTNDESEKRMKKEEKDTALRC